jgi:ABC-type nitrate/sulfonate/bicarbonate transport system permease component
MRSSTHFALLGCAFFVVAWAAAAELDLALLSSPAAVAGALVDLATRGRLFADAAASIYRVAIGVGIALVLTMTLAAMAILVPRLSDMLSGPIELARPVPPLAWVPLAIMVFGVGNSSAAAIVALGAFFPMWLSTIRGVAGIRHAHILTAMSLGARSPQLAAYIFIPSVLPHALHGLRVGVGMGWFCVVAAEMLGASSGLGHGVQRFSLNLEIANLYAYICLIGVLGFTFNILLVALERKVCAWHTTESWRNE